MADQNWSIATPKCADNQPKMPKLTSQPTKNTKIDLRANQSLYQTVLTCAAGSAIFPSVCDVAMCLVDSIMEVEGQGSFTDGILCMAWSPDHELVLFVSAVGNLILMTCEFDTISEKPMLSSEFGEGKESGVGCDRTFYNLSPFLPVFCFFVIVVVSFALATPISVGWGKKETQFRGSLGKATPEMLKQKACHTHTYMQYSGNHDNSHMTCHMMCTSLAGSSCSLVG